MQGAVRKPGRYNVLLLVALAAGLLLAIGPGPIEPSVRPESLPALQHPDRNGQGSEGGGEEALDAYAKLPLTFVENRGQTDRRVRYHAQGPGYALFFTPEEVRISLTKQVGASGPTHGSGPDDGEDSSKPHGAALALRFVGANPGVVVDGEKRVPGEANYLRGDDPDGWRTGLAGYTSVVYRDLWPNVDMMLRGQDGKLKYEFRVRPGARLDDIRLAYAGAGGLALDDAGRMLVETPLGELRDSAPVSYQQVDGKRVPVESRFVLENGGKQEYGFAVGPGYRPDRALIIDPGVDYSTFLGGSSHEEGNGVTVDGSGNAYVAGTTQSANFPTTLGAFDRTFAGGVVDVFVSKLNAAGSALVYSTYLGGTPTPLPVGGSDFHEFGRAVAVDSAGNAYVTGQTSSSNFPTTSGAFDRTLNVGNSSATDVFVTKLNATGSRLLYSTFLGGTNYDDGAGISINGSGEAYVTGQILSSNFPTTAGAFDRSANGEFDGFLTKLNATGSALAYSTYLGGAESESPGEVAVDSAGNAYVGGSTRSAGFPTTPGAFDTTHNSSTLDTLFDVFVTKVNPTGSALAYSTFLGGSDTDFGDGLAIDAAGNAYVSGGTISADFPTTAGAFDTSRDGGSDAFVARLNASGSALGYSTLLGGADGEGAAAIALGAGNSAWVTGGTSSTNFPTTADGFDTRFDGTSDAFVVNLNADGSALAYSTFLGAGNADNGRDLAADTAGNVYVTGATFSPGFPTTQGAFDRVFNGDPAIFWGDAFVTKFGSGTAPPPPQSAALSSLGLSPTSVTGGNPSTGTVTLTTAAPAGGAAVALSSSNTAAATVPASVTVPAGSTSATFTVSTSSVGANTPATISASYGGVSRTAILTVNAPAASTDSVSISRAEYDSAKRLLRVEASSSNSSATLRVHVTATNELIGTLSGGRGEFSRSTNPQNITVRSSLGGSATRTVTLR